MKNFSINDIQVDDVISVYSGKDGACCCGCSGKHTYHPKYIGDTRVRGYKIDKEECNLRTIKMILNKIKKNIDPQETIQMGGEIFTIIGKRLYVAYLDLADLQHRMDNPII